MQLNVNGGRALLHAKEYLRPAMARGNLRVETGVLATRIVIEQGRAVAVEALQDGRPVTFRGRGESVCSAGALETPKLLMLSGIGDTASRCARSASLSRSTAQASGGTCRTI